MATVQASTFGLRNVKMLQGLSQERLEILAARFAWRTVEPGQVIVARNSHDRDVHFVVSGHVRVTSFSAGGKQVTFRDEEPGEMFGDLAAIDGAPRSADVLALDSVLVASLSPEDFRALIAAEELVRERVLQRLAGLVRQLSERVIELSTLGVQNRIHAELLRLARASGATGTQARIDPAPKHADMASQVSTYREQVTRELSLLTKQGLLAKDGNALVLLDVPKLERMVEEVRSAA
ncbi:Crp/Fnr family transcriptional regulator [Ramlibacter alkalitolerans]|uniref:Crp/Fnr family transcriptional regulator n=1 Tax=Ramlibacter alkalitolerans TaxID=2039631 RepID=A0ABS1JRI6_9BURK|nr:Crp/Fnr family transcriptional regulator [Ramlibacter alkalitolerans]MBL0426771.1 Crp/Fnr family transcriptional regulator [Ramlibacter alkalitolerans]